MLTLKAEEGDYLVIGDNIVIQFLITNNREVRYAVEAPKDMKITRGELYEETHPTPNCVKRLRKIQSRANAKDEDVVWHS